MPKGKPMPMACAECGKMPTKVSGEVIYPHRQDLHDRWYWKCECGAYVGCHGGTDRPLGSPAGPDLRRARMVAHYAFDPIWRNGFMRRGEAYAWLGREIGKPTNEVHISWMTIPEAEEVTRICRAALQAIAQGTHDH